MVTEIIDKAMAEIKISDLSIGDWVICNGFKATIAGYNAESGSIQVLTKQKNKMWFGLDDIEPIPITAEILEKNGWSEFSDYHNSWKLDIADNMRVWLFKNSHDWTFQVMNWGLGHNHCLAKAYITSIHQLQHALRLAGVEKEIEL